MSSKLKEDEKNEKIIRGLLKKSGNRKCINCNVLGPQYVCVTFSTFVCSTCSGIHREFSHRVKSVSMAKFTPEEIAALQSGGNERAKLVFFKDVEPHRLNSSDSSSVDKLRNFIKHVYEDRRYTGERSFDKPPRTKSADKEKPKENGRSDPYQTSSRRQPYETECRYSDRPVFSDQNPGSSHDNQRHGNHARSPVPSAIVSDWRRENRFSNRKKQDHSTGSDEKSKPEIKSSDTDNKNDNSDSKPPTVQPVADLLGEDPVPLQITEPPKDGTLIAQITESSNDTASKKDNPTQPNNEISLIDFDAISEPIVAETVPDLQLAVISPSSSLNDDIWSLSDEIPQNAVSQTLLALPAPATQSSETNAGRSQELPMDLFTATYSPVPYQGPAWQTGQLPGMGFPGQYNTAMSTTPNPFDANGGSSTSQAAAFPSMTPLNAALPNMAVNGVSVHASTAQPSWMPPQTSSYPSAVSPHVSSYAPPIPGAYMGQQQYGYMPPSRPQGYPAVVATPNPSLGGNPFG